jgi:hypothetical protein
VVSLGCVRTHLAGSFNGTCEGVGSTDSDSSWLGFEFSASPSNTSSLSVMMMRPPVYFAEGPVGLALAMKGQAASVELQAAEHAALPLNSIGRPPCPLSAT